MRTLYTIRPILSTIGLAAFLQLYGCASPEDSNSGPADSSVWKFKPRGSERTTGTEPVSTIVDARPAALINGMPVTWGELRPYLNDLAGAKALEELALDRRITDELSAIGVMVTLDDAVIERKRMLESFSDDSNDAIKRMNEWRDEQDMGDSRFESLLLRKAGLRALVRNRPTLPAAQPPSTHPGSAQVDDEQAAMDALAAELLGKTTFSVLDEQLKESWQRHKKH